MILNRISKIIFASVLIVSVVSCKKDFYDLVPYDSVPLDVAIKTEPDFLTALNGMYQGLRNVDLYGRTLPVKGDLMSDNVYLKASNSGRYLRFNQYDMIATDGNATGTWTAAYNVILRANQIINSKFADTALATSKVNIRQFKGEAYAVRALMYFELVRNFARPITVDPSGLGVPIVLAYDQEAKPARNTTAEVYAQIINDLKTAYSLQTYNLGQTLSIAQYGVTRVYNTSFLSRYAAEGILAKVYQSMGDWANAKTAALDVVTSSGATMVDSTGYVNYWKNAIPLTSKVETLFEVTADIAGNLGTDALAYMYDQNGYGDLLGSTNLYTQYRATDVRKQIFIVSGTNYINNKYSNTTNASEKDDIKVLRLADVYLILAEAYANTADEPNARIRLNQVAQRREPSFAGYTSTGTALIDDIIAERRKELAFEGDRYWDLQRLNKVIARPQGAASAVSIATDNTRRIFPIPQAETDANPIIKPQQNPGY